MPNTSYKIHLAATEHRFSRIDRALIYPPFLSLCERLIVNLYRQREDFWATSGTRTEAEQNALYAQGRTAPGEIVTNARFGSSAHNYGIAIDFVKDRNPETEGLQPDWTFDAYLPLAEEAVRLNLESGFHWKIKDGPHIQLPLERTLEVPPGMRLWTFLKNLYDSGGYPAVWRELDRYEWGTKNES